jgi:hypothetical protein
LTPGNREQLDFEHRYDKKQGRPNEENCQTCSPQNL